MPTYQYVCSKCDHEFEVFQAMTDPVLRTCPKDKCPQKRWGKGRVKRVLSAGAGILFKGSGFYVTDYRSEGYRAAAKKESESATKTDSATSTPAASKADSKTEKTKVSKPSSS